MILQGIEVLLHVRTRTGVDAFGAPVYEETAVTVSNVMVCPVSTEDVTDALELYGKHAVYQLLIPKGDTHSWEDVTVEFFGQRWRTFGFVQEWMEAMVPGEWNRRVKVERYG